MNKPFTTIKKMIAKSLILFTFGVLTSQIATAQSGRMKDPVSFTLKNGMTLVVAENDGANHVFSGFTSEAQPEINKAGAQEVLHIMLNNIAGKLDSCVSFNNKGGNVKAEPEIFSKALFSLLHVIEKPEFNAETFNNAKATLIKNVQTGDQYYDESINQTRIEQLTLEDVKSLYNTLMVPSSCVLTVVGNIKINQAKNLANKTFGSWTTGQGTESTK